MNTIQYELGGGASIALPADVVARNLIEHLQRAPCSAMGASARPVIGECLRGEGGTYAGEIRGDDGTTYGIIIAQPEDVGAASWGPNGKHNLSEWDGLSNTNRLRNECPAAKLAGDYEADGHVDFYLPARREMMVAMANVPHLFDKDSWYWTSTPYGQNAAWAVDFEHGSVDRYGRASEFRVRPFRRLPL